MRLTKGETLRLSVCVAFDVRERELIAPTRGVDEIARARFAAMLLGREWAKMSLQKLGRVLKRDHTTVSYGSERAKQLMERDGDFRAMYKRARVLAERSEGLTEQAQGPIRFMRSAK